MSKRNNSQPELKFSFLGVRVTTTLYGRLLKQAAMTSMAEGRRCTVSEIAIRCISAHLPNLENQN